MASKPPEFDPQQMSEQMKQSAQQIWQAGLGAFAKAQQEGGKVFESLVKEGSKLQETTLQAQAKVAEAAAKASFDAFRADPTWIAAKEASEKKAGGSLTIAQPNGVKSEFLVPTDYSPVK